VDKDILIYEARPPADIITSNRKDDMEHVFYLRKRESTAADRGDRHGQPSVDDRPLTLCLLASTLAEKKNWMEGTYSS